MNAHHTLLILAAFASTAASALGANPPAAAPLGAKPSGSSSYEARFKEVRERVAELFHYRDRTPAPIDPRHNPFRTPGGVVMTARSGTDGDTGGRLAAGSDPAPSDSGTSGNLSLLQQGVATLKVSGIVEISGRAHLVINKRPYKEGDVVPTQVQGETLYLRVKEITRRSVTLTHDDAEMTLKY